MKSLLLEFEALMNIYKPVDEDLTHVRADMGHDFFLLTALG